MNDFTRLKRKLMESTEFKEEYEKTRAEFEIMKAIIDARCENNLTQKQLSEIIGIRQSNLSRIESGACSPNVATLNKIAEGLGKELHIEFREI